MVNLKRIGEASAALGLTKKEFEALVEKGEITYELSKGKQRLFDVDKYLGSSRSSISSKPESPKEAEDEKPLKKSPYWEQDNVDETKKLLKILGLELPTLGPNNVPRPSKIASISWNENGLITTPLENKPKVSEAKIWNKLVDAHLKRWGKIDVGNLSYKSKMTRIYLEDDKILEFKKLFDDARFYYNLTTDFHRGEKCSKNKLTVRDIFVTKHDENYPRDHHFEKVVKGYRDFAMKKETEELTPEILKNKIDDAIARTPKDIRAEASIEATIAHNNFMGKTGEINPEYHRLKKALAEAKDDTEAAEIKQVLINTPYHIKADPSNLRHRRSKDRYQHIFVPKSAIRKHDGCFLTIYPTYNLGKIRTEVPMKPITSQFQIRWDQVLNVYHIITAEPIDNTFKKTKKGIRPKASTKDPRVVPKGRPLRVVCGDPGLRTIMTAINSDGEIKEYGKEWYLNPKIKERLEKLDDREKASKTSLRGLRHRKRYNTLIAKRQAALHRSKLRNMIDDLHKKLANKVINSNDVIIYPKMTAKGKNLPQNIKDLLNLLSHCKFHDYIAWKAATKGKFVIDQNESYTTKTCYSCGYLTEVGGNKVYTCSNKKCGVVCDRDINACFNILTRFASCLSSRDPWVPPRTFGKKENLRSSCSLVTNGEIFTIAPSG